MARQQTAPCPRDALKVKGFGIPQQVSPSVSPERLLVPTPTSSTSDDECENSAEYTVLDGVRDMNLMLQKQIDAIRSQIRINEKNYNDEKVKLMEAKYSEMQTKETEIDDLKESLTHREENIKELKKSAAQKDKAIRDKCMEIDDLKKMIDQIKNKARKIHRQVVRAQKQREQLKLDDDPLYRQKKEEIGMLTEEMEQLRSKLATVDAELAKAMKVIKQQNEKLKIIDSERLELQDKFKEDLDNVSKSMKHEVERMREVMLQNNEEMKILREENTEMHSDVRVIKKLIQDSVFPENNSPQKSTQSSNTELLHVQQLNGHSRVNVPVNTEFLRTQQIHGHGRVTVQAITEPVYTQQLHRQVRAIAPSNASSSKLGHKINSNDTEHTLPPLQIRSSNNFVTNNGSSDNLRFNSASTPLSKDNGPRKSISAAMNNHFNTTAKSYPTKQLPHTDNKGVSVQNIQLPYGHNNVTNRTVDPPVSQPSQEVQPLFRQSSIRASKSGVKKSISKK